MTIGTHNLTAVPVILAVIIIGVAVYLYARRQRGRKPTGRS
jgi:hypothetical protein